MTEPVKTIQLRPKGTTTAAASPSSMNANSTIRLKAPGAAGITPSPMRIPPSQPQPLTPPTVQPPVGMRIISPPSPPTVDTATAMLSAVEIQRPPMGQVPRSTMPTDTGTLKLVAVGGSRTDSNVVPAHTAIHTAQSTASKPISINTTASRPLGAPIGTGTTALPKLEITSSATTIKLDTPAPQSPSSTIRLTPAHAPQQEGASASSPTIKLNATSGIGKKTLSLKREGGPTHGATDSSSSTIKFDSSSEEKSDFAEASIFQEPYKRIKHEKPDQSPFTGGYIYLGFSLFSAILITLVTLGITGQLSNLWPTGELIPENEYKTSPTFASYENVNRGNN